MSIENTSLDSDLNAFKNLQVTRGNLNLPVSVLAGATYTDTAIFTIQEDASFIELYVYNSDYWYYFNFLDSQWRNFWRKVNTITPNLNNYWMRSNAPTIEIYNITMEFLGNQVIVTLRYTNVSGSTRTFSPPIPTVPVAFVEYTLGQ